MKLETFNMLNAFKSHPDWKLAKTNGPFSLFVNHTQSLEADVWIDNDCVYIFDVASQDKALAQMEQFDIIISNHEHPYAQEIKEMLQGIKDET